MDKAEEKRNKRTGALVSVGVHLALLVLFFFILAWREPNPPLPEFGIELNFGLVDEGSGEEATPEPTSDNTSQQEPAEVIEETTEEVTESTESTVEEVSEEITDQVETTDSEEVTSNLESPDVREPQEKVIKNNETKKEVKEDSKPVEEAKEEKKEVNPQAVFTKPDDGTKGSEGEGDDTDAQGDKGDPRGLDERASYTGNPGGGGGGPDLQITGWYWDEIPNKKDQSDQSGRIKFRFRIDEDGYVTSVITLETTVSPNVVAFYKKQLENTTFSQTNDAPPPLSTEGIVTFIIKSK